MERRYDLDWLRTLAFLLLIGYHVGMYYVADWGWHIKSEQTSELLQELMIMINPWRMSLLFFISAMVLSLVEQRYSGMKLLQIRSRRLLIPLLLGMFVLVVPQVYYEALNQDLIQPGYLDFWKSYADPNTDLLTDHHSPIGLLTWNHLWYLPYLWCYSVIFLLLRYPVNWIANTRFIQNTRPWVAVAAIVLVLAFVWLNLKRSYPSTHALLDDWYNHGKYFSVFVFGYVFARQEKWWQWVIQQRNVLLFVALLGYAFLVADRFQLFQPMSDQFNSSLVIRGIYAVILSVNHWVWILAMVGLAGFYLNKPSKLLSYSNQAVLPWYMFHQTLIIVIAWWLKPLAINAGFEWLVVIIATTVGCLLGYEIIKRWSVSRWLFGLKV